MFHKILVAIDHSPVSEQVFAKAVTLAKSLNASLLLLHVLSPDEAEAPPMPLIAAVDVAAPVNHELWESYREQRWAFERAHMDHLRSLSEEAQSQGISAEYTLNSGNPGRTICEIARSWGSDLIVIGRRGHSGLSELFMGSISNYVMHHSPCSVLTVQGNFDGEVMGKVNQRAMAGATR